MEAERRIRGSPRAVGLLVTRLQAEIERLRGALAQYADAENWSREVGDEWWDVWEPSEDGFALARRALENAE